eukprot:572212-Rhodomonas_salina.1
MLDGIDVGGSPFKLTVDPGPTHANGCSAAGPGITGGYTGMETSFVVQGRRRDQWRKAGSPCSLYRGCRGICLISRRGWGGFCLGSQCCCG